MFLCFFFKQSTAYELRISDWSSDVCSSDLYVVRGEKLTGGVDVLTRLSGTGDITVDEAVNKFFLSEYVRAREGWNPAAAKETMRRVLSLSVPQEQEKFAVQRRPQNPNSPAAVYQSGEVVTAAVRNISFINPRVAQVRFVRTVTRPGNAPDDVSHWIATINIKYVDRPTTEAGRLDNPLGFQVVSYRADPEIES